MNRLLVKASYMATFDESLDNMPRGAIVVEDGTIVAAGDYQTLSKQGPFDEEIGSLEDDILMPGLISAHHHSTRNFRDGVADQPLECWIPFLYGAYHAGFSAEEVFLNTAWACIELIRAGVTATLDHRFGIRTQERLGIPSAVKAYRTIGLRVGLCIGVSDQNRLYYGGDGHILDCLPPETKEAIRIGLRSLNVEEFFEIWNSFFEDLHEPKGRVRIFLGPSGPRWCSDKLLRRIKESALARNTGIQIHLLETAYQRAAGRKERQESVVKRLDEFGFWGEEVSCAHGVWLSVEEMEILRARGTTVVYNPGANLRLYSGIAPVRRMIELGLPVAFGADGAGINDNNDLLAEARLGHLLQRLPGVSTRIIPPEDWFRMIVKGGARTLLEPQSLGSLAPGKKADFILVDMRRLRHPSANPEADPLGLLLQRGLGGDVHTVYIDGQPIMREHKILTVDEEAIADEIKKSMQAHYPRLQRLRPVYQQVEEEIRKNLKEWDLSLPAETRYQYNVH